MKKIILIIVIIVVAILVFWFVKGEGDVDVSDWKAFENEIGGFEVMLPSDWEAYSQQLHPGGGWAYLSPESVEDNKDVECEGDDNGNIICTPHDRIFDLSIDRVHAIASLYFVDYEKTTIDETEWWLNEAENIYYMIEDEVIIEETSQDLYYEGYSVYFDESLDQDIINEILSNLVFVD
ncbi:MAG: hypothetical protein ABH833_01150 [Parcubacteria group bacterium]